jgi:hypothetical protein
MTDILDIRRVVNLPMPSWAGLFQHNTSVFVENEVTYSNISAYNIFESGADAKLILYTLESQKYKLRKPIVITLRENADDEYIASFTEAELSRSGESPREAVEWLKSSIVTLYELLAKRPRRQLGPLPTRQLLVLGEYLVKKPYPKA